MEEVDDWMTKRGLPSKLQLKIRRHYQEVHSLHEVLLTDTVSTHLTESCKCTAVVRMGCCGTCSFCKRLQVVLALVCS